jgi:hypothetical protein
MFRASTITRQTLCNTDIHINQSHHYINTGLLCTLTDESSGSLPNIYDADSTGSFDAGGQGTLSYIFLFGLLYLGTIPYSY